jgi:hypothetical protein
MTTTAIAAMIASMRMIGITLRASQALPPTLTLKRSSPDEMSTLNQSKNMKMKRRTADAPAIFSPKLSLSTSISSS